jgi:hypothetical protein
MDPDLVRQQEEAERGAMRLAGRKPGSPAPLAAAAVHTQQAGPHSQEHSSARGRVGAIGAGEWAAAQVQPRPKQGTGRSALWYFSDFMSFGLAGAMLGGALGTVAANYIQLSAGTAELVIFGPAGFFAIVCATASFFAGKTAQPRASRGT